MNDPYRAALEEIARLALEEADYDYDPAVRGVDIAVAALGWVNWECSSRFTNCRAQVVGNPDVLESGGWVLRDGEPRCPKHAASVDPTCWGVEAPHP